MYGQQPMYAGNQGMPQMYPDPFNRFGNNRPHFDVIRVNGRNGAEAFEMDANSSVLLLDTTAPLIWHKETDGAGYPKLTPYQISPVEQKEPEPAVSEKSLQETLKTFEDNLIARLEEMIGGKPNS